MRLPAGSQVTAIAVFSSRNSLFEYGYVAVHPDYDAKEELEDGLVFCNRTLGFVNAPALMQHIVRTLQSVTIDVVG